MNDYEFANPLCTGCGNLKEECVCYEEEDDFLHDDYDDDYDYYDDECY